MLITTYNSFLKFATLINFSALPSVISDEISNFEICDMSKSSDTLKEGILGEVGEFPWMGVLRVPLKQQDHFVIAATGAVLVTVNFVIVNADDISQTSQERLKHEGTIHFVPKANKTWTAKLKNFLIHPEYEYATLNTIALVEMDLDVEYDDEQHRAIIKPVCWPGVAFNTSNALYVTGFTDERMLLEKFLFKSQYVPKTLCDEFYKRQYLKANKLDQPKNYICTFAMNKKQHCQWDNGMVLVSNVTGHWTIVGFGVAGPGCSAPTRFLDMSAYIDWVHSSSRDPHTYDYYGGRQVHADY